MALTAVRSVKHAICSMTNVKMSFRSVLVNYFKVWLKVPNTTFALSYMDLDDEITKIRKELILNEVWNKNIF